MPAEEDPDTIEYILAHNNGPFILYAMREEDVEEIDEEDIYDKDNALEKRIVSGQQVMQEMDILEKIYKGCVIFMVDKIS